MTEEWLIDGYNLLHAKVNLGKHKKQVLDRSALLAQLSSFASQKNVRVTVVLDGQGDQGELDTLNTLRFSVVYSQKVSADAFIERSLFEKRLTSKLVVVTNDHAISNIARGGGALVHSCDEFFVLMKEYQSESSEVQQKNAIRSHGFNRPFDEKLKNW